MKSVPLPAIAVLIASLSLFTGGCASIVKGTTQAIPVGSSPSGADVKIDGNKVGQTPTSVAVKRKTDHLMTIEKSGFQTETFAITRNIGGAVFGNIIAGGLVGWGVDAISGAQYNLTPATINVTLKPLTGSEQATPVAQSGAAVFVEELRKLDAMHVAKTVTDEEYAMMRTSLVQKYSK
jgi:PEGA domain